MARQEKVEAADAETYINTETYAQYVDNVYASVDHGVVIVGWDDNYSVSNFPADHQPPANGAWIVRNSWGTDYGNDGYLYISYYDQSLSVPESFEYDVTAENLQTATMDIQAYDTMPTTTVNSVKMNETTYMSNIFTIDEEEVLGSVSVMTAALNSSVTVRVYLLNEDAESPTDGVMLDAVTGTFTYGGYHRVDLHQNYLIPAGSRISIVQLQRVTTSDGTFYAVPYSAATSEKYSEVYNRFQTDANKHAKSYSVAVINEGESFIKLDGEWTDWADVIQGLYDEGAYFDYMSYDNLAMKAYLYPADELDEIHSFGDAEPYCGMNIRVCEDCGMSIVEP